MVFPPPMRALGRTLRGARSAGCAVAIASVLSLASTPAAASPEDLFGYGARTSAMGATGTAFAGGYESAWHNPALASDVRGPKLTLGYTGGVLRLDARGEGLPGRTSSQPIKGTTIGAELPVPLGGKLAHRVGIALAFYEPTDVVVRGRVLYPEKTQSPMLENRAQSVTIRAGVGADIGYGIRVGVGFAALAEIVGTVVAATDATGRVGTRVEDQLVATYAPTFGATYDLPLKGPETWRIGLTYRGTLAARFAVVIDGTKLSSLQIPLFNISGLAQYDPAQVALEVARREELNVLAAQVVYKHWSGFPGVLEPTVVCTEGGAGACGLTPPKIDWSDTFVVRLGADQGFRIARGAVLHVRGGGFFETTPLPGEIPGGSAYSQSAKGVVAVPTRYYDSDRVALTVGTGLSLQKPLPPIDLDLFAQHHILLPRTVSSVDPNGNALSKGESSGHVTVFGMTAGVTF
jgi:long-chain fatty acid transport protein